MPKTYNYSEIRKFYIVSLFHQFRFGWRVNYFLLVFGRFFAPWIRIRLNTGFDTMKIIDLKEQSVHRMREQRH